jgi:putative peptidoglycan lipid II flippase
MGYAALGSAIAGALALWLLGSYSPDGFAWSSREAALVTIVVVGPVMLAVYFFLLTVFRVTELRDLMQPLLGRLRRRSATGTGVEPRGEVSVTESTTPARATVSVDTGLIPRISGEFDAASFRAGPDMRGLDEAPHGQSTGPDGGYLPAEELPSTAQGGLGRADIPLPGRRTYQGPAGHNPYFPFGRKKKK